LSTRSTRTGRTGTGPTTRQAWCTGAAAHLTAKLFHLPHHAFHHLLHALDASLQGSATGCAGHRRALTPRISIATWEAGSAREVWTSVTFRASLGIGTPVTFRASLAIAATHSALQLLDAALGSFKLATCFFQCPPRSLDLSLAIAALFCANLALALALHRAVLGGLARFFLRPPHAERGHHEPRSEQSTEHDPRQTPGGRSAHDHCHPPFQVMNMPESTGHGWHGSRALG
jgi:hypothetical protein